MAFGVRCSVLGSQFLYSSVGSQLWYSIVSYSLNDDQRRRTFLQETSPWPFKNVKAAIKRTGENLLLFSSEIKTTLLVHACSLYNRRDSPVKSPSTLVPFLSYVHRSNEGPLPGKVSLTSPYSKLSLGHVFQHVFLRWIVTFWEKKRLWEIFHTN